jgi:hypothetical protein
MQRVLWFDGFCRSRMNQGANLGVVIELTFLWLNDVAGIAGDPVQCDRRAEQVSKLSFWVSRRSLSPFSRKA